MRHKTKKIKIGKIFIGGDSDITIQSMCSTLTKDADATINQIHELEGAGCEIIRVSVPDIQSANALKKIKENISIPLVADIHFDWKLAVESAKYADKLRINPGNIGSIEKINKVVDAAKQYALPIRVGINAGSLQKDIEKQHGISANAMVESALENIRILEEQNFYDIIVSLKASDVLKTIEAYNLFSEKYNYPLHLGITEAGTLFSGTISSSIGIGNLLLNGIGDTIRVSLSANPVEEVRVGKQILKSLNLREFGAKIISCPTCARANFDVASIAQQLEKETEKLKKNISIAIMGCGVNGPGEARESDLGIVGGKGSHLFYKNGEVKSNVQEKDILKRLLDEIRE